MATKSMTLNQTLKQFHNSFYPMISKLVDMLHSIFKKAIDEHRTRGFRTEWNRKLDSAIAEFAKRFLAVPKEWHEATNPRDRAHWENVSGAVPSYEPLVQKARDIALVGAEMEIALFPKWFCWLIEELERVGLIDYDENEKKIKTLTVE